MKIVSIGGGPAGLYFGILMKKADPSHSVTVIERNKPDDTFGFGVVFSDATLGNLQEADPESFAAMKSAMAHWDDIDTHFGGEVHRSTGHGFCGMERKSLLEILQKRAGELGVDMQFETEVTDLEPHLCADLVLAADGVGSGVRERFAEHFGPDIDTRPNKFVWLGTTVPFDAFTFYFKRNEHGLWRVHAYRYSETGSTFIVECTDATFRRAGMAGASEDDTIAYLGKVFEEELAGHPLIKNRSIWRNFPTIKNARWHHQNVVLVGDAAHTAHFSIGSGTKLAMEDCIALSDALAREPDLDKALDLYEQERRPDVERLQRAAQVSLEWFENTERYEALPPRQFTFSLLTRSLRVTHANLAKRDPDLVSQFDAWFSERAAKAAGRQAPATPPPPMFTPLKLREVVLDNRAVGGGDDAGVGLRMFEADVSSEVVAAPEAGVSGITFVGSADARGWADAAAQADAAGYSVLEIASSDGLAALQAVRSVWPDSKPVAVRVLTDEGGDTAALLGRALADHDCDLVVVTSRDARDRDERLFTAAIADRIRQETGVPVMVEGGITSYEDMNSLLAAGRADLCRLDLVLAREPAFMARAADEQGWAAE